MTDPRLVDQIGARISEVLATSPARDVEKNLRELLAAFFDRFDLVTREDFEVQKRVLERARARIADLEGRIVELEKTRTPGQPQA
jgi:BMFP domain-containing protein YqiC